MLFRKQNAAMRYVQGMNSIVFLLLVITIVIAIAFTACIATKGSIVILESLDGTGFTMEFNEFSEKSKCQLSPKKNDELQIGISRTGGKIDLSINGKNGSEPYTGNNLRSGMFTVTVPQADEYVISIAGDNATGSLEVRNLGNRQAEQ